MTNGDGPGESEPSPAAPNSFIAAAVAFWRRVRERKVAQWGAGYIEATYNDIQDPRLAALDAAIADLPASCAAARSCSPARARMLPKGFRHLVRVVVAAARADAAR